MIGYSVKPYLIWLCLVERTSRAPIAPNNVVINHIVVTGGLLSTPNITRSSSGAASKYTMTVAKFNIQYNVVECGHGMELIQSHSSNSYGIKLSRVSISQMIEITK